MGEAVIEFHFATQINGAEIQINGLVLVAGVIDRKGAFGAVQLLDVLDHDETFALLGGDIGLQMQGVLVQGDEVTVGEQLEGLRFDICHVTADEQRRCHDTPHPEVGLVLDLRHRASHFQHIHVIVMPVVAIGTQVEVLGEDFLD